MAQDPITDYLRGLQIPDEQKAELWDLMTSSPDAATLASNLERIGVDNNIKADLWDLKSGGGAGAGTDAPMPEADRPIDPQTGRPVRVPGDPGFMPFGDEPERPDASMLELGGRAVGGALSTVNPVNIISGLYNAVRHPIDTGRAVINAQVDQGRQAAELFRRGGVANTVEGIGRSAAAALPLIGPAAAHAGEEIGSGDPRRMATGVGEAVGMAAAGPAARAVTTRVAPLMRRGAERMIEATMRPGDDILAMTDLPINNTASRAAARQQLARTALDEGVTPGLISGAHARPRARMAELQTSAQNTLAGPAGDAAVVPQRIIGPSQRGLMDRLQDQVGSGPDVRAAGEVAREATGNVRLTTPNARNLNRMASGNVDMVRARPGARADATRAIGRDARREIARAAPDTADDMGRMSRLEPVAEAYERIRTDPIEIPGLPTIQARILLSGVNRLVGPGARQLDRASRLSPAQASRLARASVLADLLGQTPPAPK
jgi:hypothetical protein